MTKKELAEHCEANNIQFDEKMTKKELLDAIGAADSAINNEDDESDDAKNNEGVEDEAE